MKPKQIHILMACTDYDGSTPIRAFESKDDADAYKDWKKKSLGADAADSGYFAVVSVPLYTHPSPDHTALLNQALESLDDSRDDVCECLDVVMEHAMRHAGYECYDERIAAYREQLAKHDAAIAAIEGALK